MRTVVLDRDLVEGEVKPHDLIEEYRRLLDVDVRQRLLDGLEPCRCPGCLSGDARIAFARSGLQYMECKICSSLYVSPRPAEAVLDDFYRNARSAVFWRERILPVTKETRQEKLFRPRVQWLLDVVDEYRPHARSSTVVGYHNELLIEELLTQTKEPLAIEIANPAADIEFAGSDLPGVSVRSMSVSRLSSLASADLFLAFDILDRCADPEVLFKAARRVLEPGGLLLATTTLGSGLDVQLLWDAADNIHPPERLNLLSVEGLTQLCQRQRFEILEFSTPGVFDVEAVRHAVAERPEGDWPRFIRYLVGRGDDAALEALQEYLQRFRFSSFGRIALKKVD